MAAISKAEYLKRYLSTSADEDKKKKRKKKPKAPQKFARSVIVDDDVSWKDLQPKDEESTVKEEKFENAGDEAPVVYDEDGVEAISLDVYKKREDDQKSKWAPLNTNNGAEGQEKVRSSSPNRNLSLVRRSRADTPDNSPPRNRNHGSPDLSPSRDKIRSLKKRPKEPPSRGEDSRYLSSEKDSRADSDFSLGAKRSRHDSPDLTPPRARGQRHDSPDTSPVRRNRHGSPDQPPARRQRHDSPDLSPDRGIKGNNSDHSPPRRRRHDSSDLSPPRGTKGNDSDQSPPRRRRHDSSDLSPPRGTKGSDSDQSPPRRRQHDSSDLSPPRGTKGSDSDQSPPKRRRQDSPDLSPPRSRGAGRGSDLSPRRQRSSTSTDKDRKAGLLSAEDLKRENALTRKREDEMFAKMDSRKSGKDAKTVHRDKSGKIRDLEAEEQKKKEEDKKKAIHDEKFKKWGKGIVQTQEAQKKMEDYLHEVNKPLARYKDDKDLDAMLKEQEREDDPMLAYMQKKKSVVKKKAGVKERPTYKGPPPPPNRFRIPPGYRWDGVDRSNGFENKRFTMLANKKATEKMAHKWSVEEM